MIPTSQPLAKIVYHAKPVVCDLCLCKVYAEQGIGDDV